MTPLALIVNPRARKFLVRPGLVERVRRIAGSDVRVYVTEDLAALARAAEEALASGVRTVVLAGGDGTFMAGVSAFAHAGALSRVRFVFAPAGTVATVARNFGHRADLIETVRTVLRAGTALPVVVRPTLRVVADDDTFRIGFTIGTGLVARFFERYEAAGAGGHWTALRIVLRIFTGSFKDDAFSKSVLDPLPCRVSVEGRPLPASAFSLVVSSVLTDLGIRMRVTYRGGEDLERLHLVASPLPPKKLGPQWPRVARGMRLAGSENFDDLVRSFSVDFGPGGGPYVLDGDTFHARTIEVSAGPLIDVALV